MVSIEGNNTQLFLGQMVYFENRISVALFTRNSDKKDCVVLSRPLFHLPETGEEDLFEQLLTWNNGGTEMVHFALDEPLNTINLVCFRIMDGFSFQEFHRCLENLIVVARNSVRRLQQEYGLMQIQ